MKPSRKIIDYKQKLIDAWLLFLVSPTVSLSLYVGYWLTWLLAGEGSIIRIDVRNGSHIWVIAYCSSFTIFFALNLAIAYIKYLLHRKEQNYV